MPPNRLLAHALCSDVKIFVVHVRLGTAESCRILHVIAFWERSGGLEGPPKYLIPTRIYSMPLQHGL